MKGGVDLVGKTSASLDTIATQTVTINQHMNSIATSYRKQSAGLAEVNTAGNQIDQVTQQNAAMVEENHGSKCRSGQRSGAPASADHAF